MSRFRIVIRAFTLRRDIASALIFARLLERAGAQVIIASGRDFQRVLRHWNPDAVLVNTVGQIRRCARLTPNAAIILWPGEGAQAIESSDATQLAAWPDDYDRLDLALLWGQRTRDFFHETLPDADHSKLIVCGNPRLDMVKFNPGLATVDRRTIGFIGRYHSLNRYNAVPAIFSLQNDTKRDGVVWQVDSFVAMMTVIHRIIAETDLTVSIRPHPLEAPEGYEFVHEAPFAGRIEIDRSFDVAAWTARQRSIVTPSSQSFYESYVLGVPTFHLDPLNDNADMIRQLTPHAAMSQLVSYQPDTYDALMDLITRDPAPTPLRNEEVDRHLDEFHEWFSDASALARAVDATMNLLSQRPRQRGRRLPTAVLKAWDRLSFARVNRRDPLHQNFNYHEGYHVIPEYYADIVENITKAESVDAGTPSVTTARSDAA